MKKSTDSSIGKVKIKDKTQRRQVYSAIGQPLDLIVPCCGERLIKFVKKHAKCAVLASGCGNNFLYVHKEVIWKKVWSSS